MEVASPFLTQAAINLLKGSLTTRELLIWEACGDYWRLPKAEFEGSMVPYKPMFNDGWSPGYIVFDEDEPPKPSIRRNPSQREQNNQVNNQLIIFQISHSRLVQVIAQPVLSDTESDYGSVGSNGGFNDRGQEEWRDLLIKSGVAIALVTHSRDGANAREMSVNKGDYLEIINMDKKWWKVRNKSQEVTQA